MQGNTEQQLVEGLSIAMRSVSEAFKQFTEAVTSVEAKTVVVRDDPVVRARPEVVEEIDLPPKRKSSVKLRKADPTPRRRKGGKRLPRGFWKSGGRNRKIAKRKIKLDAHLVSVKWMQRDPLNYPLHCLKVALIICHDMRDYDNVHPSTVGNMKYLVTSLVGLSKVLVGKDSSGLYSRKLKPFFEIACLESEATAVVDLPDGMGWLVLSVRKDQVSIALVSDIGSVRSQWDQIQSRFIGKMMKEFKKAYPKTKTLVIKASSTDSPLEGVVVETGGGNSHVEEVTLQ